MVKNNTSYWYFIFAEAECTPLLLHIIEQGNFFLINKIFNTVKHFFFKVEFFFSKVEFINIFLNYNY